MKKILSGKSQFLASALSVVICVFLVSAFVYAATTVGTNISTAGTITSTDYGQFNNVSTTDTLYAGGYVSSTGGFYTQGAGHVETSFDANNVSTTDSLYAAGTLKVATTTSGYGEVLGVTGASYLDGNASTSGYVYIAKYLKLEPIATPTPVTIGMCFIHTTSKHLKCYDGVAWLEAI